MGESHLLHEPGDDDSGFLVSVARPVEVPAAFQRMTDEDPVVGCPVRAKKIPVPGKDEDS